MWGERCKHISKMKILRKDYGPLRSYVSIFRVEGTLVPMYHTSRCHYPEVTVCTTWDT